MPKSKVNKIKGLNNREQDVFDTPLTESDLQTIEMQQGESSDTIKNGRSANGSRTTTFVENDDALPRTSDNASLLSNQTYDVYLPSGEGVHLDGHLNPMMKDFTAVDRVGFRDQVMRGDFSRAAEHFENPFTIERHREVLNDFVASVEDLSARAERIKSIVDDIEDDFGCRVISDKDFKKFSDSVDFLNDSAEMTEIRLQQNENGSLSDKALSVGLDDELTPASLAEVDAVSSVKIGVSTLNESISTSAFRSALGFFKPNILMSDMIDDMISETTNFFLLGFNELLVTPTLQAISSKYKAEAYAIRNKNGLIGPLPGLAAEVENGVSNSVRYTQYLNPLSFFLNLIFNHHDPIKPPVVKGLEHAKNPTGKGTIDVFDSFKDLVSHAKMTKSGGIPLDLTALPDQILALRAIQERYEISAEETGNIASAIYWQIVKPRVDSYNAQVLQLKETIHEMKEFDEAKEKYFATHIFKIKHLISTYAHSVFKDFNAELHEQYSDSRHPDGLSDEGIIKGFVSMKAFQWLQDHMDIFDDWARSIISKDIKNLKTNPQMNTEALEDILKRAFTEISQDIDRADDMDTAIARINAGDFGKDLVNSLKESDDLIAWVPNNTPAYTFDQEEALAHADYSADNSVDDSVHEDSDGDDGVGEPASADSDHHADTDMRPDSGHSVVIDGIYTLY